MVALYLYEKTGSSAHIHDLSTFLGGNRDQNIPHRPAYPAGSAGYITLGVMKNIPPRSIAASESNVIREALLNAPLDENSRSMVEQLQSLKVVGECECGCRSLYFRSIEKNDYRVADGVGYLPDGERVGVMVWSTTDGRLAALEIDDHGGGGVLPINVCSWQEAGKREAAK